MTQLTCTKYISLTTYRRDGRPVSTPVWFALSDGHVLVRTAVGSGKAKRIRAKSRVTLAPCTGRGRPLGEAFGVSARCLPAEEGPHIEALLSRRYGLTKRCVDMVIRLGLLLRRQTAAHVYIELTAA